MTQLLNRKSIVVATVWLLSLVAVAGWAQRPEPVRPPVIVDGMPMGPVITGSDLGFQRVVGVPGHKGAVVGRWLVRVDGQWMPTESPLMFSR
jgi:hypothetical protein